MVGVILNHQSYPMADFCPSWLQEVRRTGLYRRLILLSNNAVVSDAVCQKTNVIVETKSPQLSAALGRPTLRVQRYRCRSRVSLFNRSILCVAWLLSTLCQVSLCPHSCFRPLMMFRPPLYRLW